MHIGLHRIMLRNLLLTGLTALSLASLASSAHAGGRGSSATRKTSEAAHRGQTSAPVAEPDLERPAATVVAPVKKKGAKVTARNGAARRIARRLQGAAVNQSLLRQSWTLADLNPMPALLDLDDTAKSLRRATAEIARLMTR
jgi:hypothetical protein